MDSLSQPCTEDKAEGETMLFWYRSRMDLALIL
jgi:hypothetical protein